MKKPGLKLLVAIVAVAMISIGIIYGERLIDFFYTLVFSSPNTCRGNWDCGWKITNCCPENSGAKWECVNKRTYKQIKCPDVVICPQVLSPKPTKDCVCKWGSCIAE